MITIFNYLQTLFRNKQLEQDKCGGEIHIKVGGDHGGGSFKMSYQVVNTLKPNSKDNTVVFSIFEAKDYMPNLQIGLSRYQQQIDRLQKMSWR